MPTLIRMTLQITMRISVPYVRLNLLQMRSTCGPKWTPSAAKAEGRSRQLPEKVTRNVSRDILSAPAASTKGESGSGRGKTAGSATERMAWVCIQLHTGLKILAGKWFSQKGRTHTK